MSRMSNLDLIQKSGEVVRVSSEKDGVWLLDSSGGRLNKLPFISCAEARRFCSQCGLKFQNSSDVKVDLEFLSKDYIPSDASCLLIQKVLPNSVSIEEWGGQDWTVLKLRMPVALREEVVSLLKKVQKGKLRKILNGFDFDNPKGMEEK